MNKYVVFYVNQQKWLSRSHYSFIATTDLNCIEYFNSVDEAQARISAMGVTFKQTDVAFIIQRVNFEDVIYVN